MKKSCFYLFTFSLVIISCNNSKIKNSNDLQELKVCVDTSNISLENRENISKKIIYYFGETRRDTIINDYHISCIIQDTDDVVAIPIRGTSDTSYFAEREVILDIKYKNDPYFNQKIAKELFIDYIPANEFNVFSFSYFDLKEMNNMQGEIIFTANLCVPDTDVCYEFEVNITKDKIIGIKEVILEDEDW